MSLPARIIILLAGVGLFITVFELVRKQRFREELSVVWLFFAVMISIGSVIDLIVDPLSKKLGIYYPPTLVFTVVIIVMILSFLYFSLVTSDLKSKVKELTQKVALLECEIREEKKDA